MHNDIDVPSPSAAKLRALKLRALEPRVEDRADLLELEPLALQPRGLVRAPQQADYEELKASIEAVLDRTEWPLESRVAAGDLHRIIRRLPWRRIDLEKATQTMRNIWQKVAQASSTYDLRDPGPIHHWQLGGGARGCNKLLIACLEELSLVTPGAGPLDARQGLIVTESWATPGLPSYALPPPPYSYRDPGSTFASGLTSGIDFVQRRLHPSVEGSGTFVSPSTASSTSVADIQNQLASPRAGSSPVTIDTSTAASAAAPGVGTQITWISPTPVKVNDPFCNVFAGTHSRVGKVALKRSRIGAAGNNEDLSLRRVAETWERLQHPRILEYLGTFQRDEYFYFVSPFIENGTLVKYIALHPGANRVKLLCETAEAIVYLHQQDIVHGDIRASNLLISDSGQVLLCDFGLTRTTDLRTPTAMKGAGTVRWQSPELLDGGSKSFKSDVYAFGMTIVEVLTGDVPFPDLRTDKAIISAVRIECKRPPKNPAVSSAGLSYEKVWAVAEACWSIIPENRISMSEALQMIHEDPALTVTQADPALPAIQEITSSSLVVDVGSFITSISNDAVSLNGHFCDVFEGIHSTAGRVALKRPRIAGTGDEDGTMRRFEREAILWQRLRHPHILEFLGTFRRNGHLYLVSPFINNGTLAQYTSDPSRTNRIRLLCETADALNYLHQNNIVHGDIKGDNVLIDDKIRCLLCDFGLSKMTDSRTSSAMRGVGTSRWQSPELLRDAPKSFSSDAYAFAMTIAEVLTGKAPFAHIKNNMAVMYAVLDRDERPPKNPTESLSGVSYLGAWDVAEACWSKNPEERISMSIAFQRLQADPSSSIP